MEKETVKLDVRIPDKDVEILSQQLPQAMNVLNRVMAMLEAELIAFRRNPGLPNIKHMMQMEAGGLRVEMMSDPKYKVDSPYLKRWLAEFEKGLNLKEQVEHVDRLIEFMSFQLPRRYSQWGVFQGKWYDLKFKAYEIFNEAESRKKLADEVGVSESDMIAAQEVFNLIITAMKDITNALIDNLHAVRQARVKNLAPTLEVVRTKKAQMEALVRIYPKQEKLLAQVKTRLFEMEDILKSRGKAKDILDDFRGLLASVLDLVPNEYQQKRKKTIKGLLEIPNLV